MGLVPDTLIDVTSYLDSNNGNRFVIMDTPGSISDRLMIPATEFGTFMDVDDSLHYTDVSGERPLTRIDVTGTLRRLSNGIAINEPDPARALEGIREFRFPMSTDVTGKGKNKVDDVPASTASGNVYFVFVLQCVCALSMLIMFALHFSPAGSRGVGGCVLGNLLAAQSSSLW